MTAAGTNSSQEQSDPVACVRFGLEAAQGYRLLLSDAVLRGPAGVHLGADTGTSIDFHDFRQYQLGDDLRRVDWGVYARSDHLVIRLYRIEVSPVLELIVDNSASMGVYSGKHVAARLLAALLAGVVRKSEGRAVLWHDGQRLSGHALDTQLSHLGFDDPLEPPQRHDRHLQSAALPIRILISDCLYDSEPLSFFTTLSHGSALFVPIMLLAESERQPGLRGGVRMINPEDGRFVDLWVDEMALATYRKRLTAHISAFERAAKQLRSPLIQLDVPDRAPALPQLLNVICRSLLAQGVIEPA